MGAEVEEDRMTCRKGCRREGMSNVLISVRCQVLLSHVDTGTID